MTAPSTAPKGFMFDLDGTLILSNRKLGSYQVIPGAVEVLQELERRGNHRHTEVVENLVGLGAAEARFQQLARSGVTTLGDV